MLFEILKNTRKRLSGPIFGSLLMLLTFFVLTTQAQSSFTVTGKVTDSAQAALPGAQVRLQGRDGLTLTTRTTAEGRYSFSQIPAGAYLLEVSAAGFTTYSADLERVAADVTRDVELSVNRLEAVVTVTANGTPQRAEDVAKVINILDRNDLTERHKIAVTSGVELTPGVRVQTQGGPGALTSVRVRGLRNTDTAVLLDGLRVRDAGDINGAAASLYADLRPANLERVEILRGSGSSLYGTNAVGGVLNLVPESGAGNRRWEIGFEGGQLTQFRERFAGSGSIGNKFGYSFGVARYDVRRGVDGNDEYGSTNGGLRLTYDFTNRLKATVNFFGSASNARVNDSPFALAAAFAGSGATLPRAQAGRTFQPDFNNPDQGRRHGLVVPSVRLTQQVNDKLTYSVAFQRTSSRRRNYNGPAVDPRFARFVPFGDFEFVSINRGTTDTFDARANISLGKYDLLTVGMEFERETLFQNSQPSFSSFNNTTDRQRTFALFAQDQITAMSGRLHLSLGARGQFYQVRGADRPGTLSNITPEKSVTGDGSAAYFIRETGTKLRAHVGNGFRAASLFERFGAGTFAGRLQRFGDPTLRAEQTISVDGGFDQYLYSERLQFSATYFYTRLQRTIAFTSFARDPLGAGRFSGYENRAGGLSRGLELSLAAALGRGARLETNYTYTNSDRKNPTLTTELVVPKHTANLVLSKTWRAWTVAGDVRFNGAYRAPVFENDFPFRTALLEFGGYVVANAFVNYRRPLSEKVTLTLFAGADNLFNREFYENGYRTPGTVGRGGIGLRF